MPRDVLAFSRTLLFCIQGSKIFLNLEISSVEIVECSRKALFRSDCCDRNQAIILVVLVLVSL